MKKSRVWNYNTHSSKIQNKHYKINGHGAPEHTVIVNIPKTIFNWWCKKAGLICMYWLDSSSLLTHVSTMHTFTVAISHSRSLPFLLCFQGRRVSKVCGLIRSCKLIMTSSGSNISAIVCIYIRSGLLKKLVKTS